jgi:AmiR/NasT family two-component response regulator
MERMDGPQPTCRVCTGRPSVVVVVAHDALRRLIVDLLARDPAAWQVRAITDQADLNASSFTTEPDLVILETRDLARCCGGARRSCAHRPLIVIGPEPDTAYESAARRAGATAWLPRDCVGEDLTGCMRQVLGCTHGRRHNARRG